jgi:Protein of unknown function (DUF3231).
MNLLETTYDMFKQFIVGDKKPLNYLEVANLWLNLTYAFNTIRLEELAYNTATDSELKQKLKDAKKIHEDAAEEISELLKKEGIALPHNTPEKPTADYTNIPDGAKLNDEEIANLMSYNLLEGINNATRGMTEAIRADVGLIFYKIINKKTALGLSLKQMMEKRGWLRVPPYYKP